MHKRNKYKIQIQIQIQIQNTNTKYNNKYKIQSTWRIVILQSIQLWLDVHGNVESLFSASSSENKTDENNKENIKNYCFSLEIEINKENIKN